MFDLRKYPVLSRLVPITAIWIWPVLVCAWTAALWVVPTQSSGVFGWTDPWLVDVFAVLVATSAAMALFVPAPQRIVARLIFLVVAGFVFLGRMSTFLVADGILNSSGWRTRTIGFVTYALVSTGHVVITSVAVMVLSNGGSSRARSTR